MLHSLNIVIVVINLSVTRNHLSLYTDYKYKK